MAWRDNINLSASLVRLLQAFGVWELISAAVIGIAQFLVARLYVLPPWAAPLAAMASMFLVLLIFDRVYSIRARKLRNQVMPDFKSWDAVNEFTTWDAAALWGGLPVTTPMLTDTAFAKFRAIKEAIRNRLIDCVALNGNSANRRTVVNRQQLIQLARHLGERPPFLFPEARH